MLSPSGKAYLTDLIPFITSTFIAKIVPPLYKLMSPYLRVMPALRQVKNKLFRKPPQKPRALILVSYDYQRTLTSLGILDMFSEIAQFSEKILVCNNTRNLGLFDPSIIDRWAIVDGSNIDHEFSGWDEGILRLSRSACDYQWILFANDTLARADSYCRQSGLLPSLNRFLNRPSKLGAIGLVHKPLVYHLGMVLNNKTVNFWMCTCCFLIKGQTLEKVESRINTPIIAKTIAEDLDSSEIISSLLDEKLRMHVENWLTSPTHGWNAAIPPPHTRHDTNLLRVKARMILKEIMLTQRLQAANISIYDAVTRSRYS